MVFAGLYPARPELDFLRADLKALHLGIADPRCRSHGGYVLPHEAGLGTFAAHIGDAERLSGDERERAGIAHDLPPALAFGSVYFDHEFTKSRKMDSASKEAVGGMGRSGSSPARSSSPRTRASSAG